MAAAGVKAGSCSTGVAFTGKTIREAGHKRDGFVRKHGMLPIFKYLIKIVSKPRELQSKWSRKTQNAQNKQKKLFWKKSLSVSLVVLIAQSCPTLRPPWTVARQAPLSLGFSRPECWSGLPFPSPGNLPDPGIEPRSPALLADSLLSEPPGKLNIIMAS